MNKSHKFTLFAIYILTVLFATSIGYNTHDILPLWLVMVLALIGGFILGTGYVRHMIEPIDRRSRELELLSRQTLHELNLPVATILANTQMLLKKEESEKNIKRLERINRAADRLKTLYSELDYTIKKQIHKVELKVCDLKTLIEEKSEEYKELFTQVDFQYDLESSSVKIDTIGFIKVLDNLVHNAIKYSQPDSIVKISLKNMQLSIEDEGIGMEEDFLLKAFGNYYQEDEENLGQGLGLGMVKEYCDRYRITIYMDSKKDQGTKITLNFNNRGTDGISRVD